MFTYPQVTLTKYVLNFYTEIRIEIYLHEIP